MKKSKFTEVRCDHLNDENFWEVDAWETDNDNEEGKTVAYIDNLTKRVIYVDNDARFDPLVAETINLKKEEIVLPDEVPFDDKRFFKIEKQFDSNFPNEIYISLEDKECFLRDLVCVRRAYHFKNDKTVLENAVEILVWGDKDNEDYTKKFRIDLED